MLYQFSKKGRKNFLILNRESGKSESQKNKECLFYVICFLKPPKNEDDKKFL